MQCFVYRSPRRENTFLYLKDKDDFSVIPDALIRVFGQPEYSFEFELSKDRKMVKENPEEVITNLKDRGFHLQMPAENQEPF